jgi:DNA-binding LacI/PurR family transcriptional regulator
MNKKIIKIYRYLLSGIAEGKFSPDDTIPKEIDLAKKFGTNRMNAQRAVKVLVDNNLVTRKKRVGTTVNKNLDYEKLQELLKATNRSIYVLYSMTPHWIHWNEASFASLENVVEPEGFSVTYRNIPTGSGRDEYKRLLNEISQAGASALVIFPDSEDADFLLDNADLLLDFQMPIYMLNRSGGPMPLDMVSFVSTDPFGDGIYVGTLLKKNNYNNIIVINEGKEVSFWGKRRCEGLKMGLSHDATKQTNDIRFLLGTEAGMLELVDIIKQSKGDIVVVAINNEYAAKFIELCQKNKLNIPDDYKLIAFDDNPLYRSYNLTSMRIPMQEIGQVFGKMICDNTWLSEHKGKFSIKLNSKLIVRETLKPEIL